MVQVIDRRSKAMGGQSNDRALSKITKIGVHWDGVSHGTIEGHERHWKHSNGWKNGGYHYFVDNDGVIHWNYNLKKTTNGVGGHNGTTAHVCYAGNHSNPMNQKQKESVKYVIEVLMKPNLPNLKQILGHNEFPNTSRYKHSTNACPGINMYHFRSYLKQGTPKKETDKMYKVQTGAFTQKKNAEDLAKRLKKDGYETYVIFEGSTPTLNKQKSVKQLYDEVMAGKHGSGETRKKSLGGRYQEVQNYINSRH